MFKGSSGRRLTGDAAPATFAAWQGAKPNRSPSGARPASRAKTGLGGHKSVKPAKRVERRSARRVTIPPAIVSNARASHPMPSRSIRVALTDEEWGKVRSLAALRLQTAEEFVSELLRLRIMCDPQDEDGD